MIVIGSPFSVANLVLPKRLRFDDSLVYSKRFDSYTEMGVTGYFAISPFANRATFLTADAGAIRAASHDPARIGKFLELYEIIDVWGKNMSLVTTQGEAWKRHRKLVGPSFSEGANRLVWEYTASSCDEWFAAIESEAEGKDEFQVRNLVEATMHLTLKVISSAGFGRNLPWLGVAEDAAEKRKGSPPLSFAESLSEISDAFVPRLIFPNWLYYLPLKRVQRVSNAFQTYENHVLEMIQERRLALTQGEKRDDILTRLIEGSDAEKGPAALSEHELLSNIYLISLAGAETSAHTVAATLLLLALNPEAQKPLYEEARKVFGPDSDAPNYSKLGELVEALAAFEETLRIFPPLVSLPKLTTAPVDLTVHTLNSAEPSPLRIHLPAQTQMRLDFASLHFSPLHRKDPFAFRPSRFVKGSSGYEGEGEGDPTFSPFAQGQRACIGKKFALVEGTMAIAKICHRYEIGILDECKQEYTQRPGEDEYQRLKRIYNVREYKQGLRYYASL